MFHESFCGKVHPFGNHSQDNVKIVEIEQVRATLDSKNVAIFWKTLLSNASCESLCLCMRPEIFGTFLSERPALVSRNSIVGLDLLGRAVAEVAGEVRGVILGPPELCPLWRVADRAADANVV